jgi:hypothetical protein
MFDKRGERCIIRRTEIIAAIAIMIFNNLFTFRRNTFMSFRLLLLPPTVLPLFEIYRARIAGFRRLSPTCAQCLTNQLTATCFKRLPATCSYVIPLGH